MNRLVSLSRERFARFLPGGAGGRRPPGAADGKGENVLGQVPIRTPLRFIATVVAASPVLASPYDARGAI